MQYQCKDCEAMCEDGDGSLIKRGWQYLDLVEPPDECSGWRCPQCVAGWDIIASERRGELN
jgi:hypothetical protein